MGSYNRELVIDKVLDSLKRGTTVAEACRAASVDYVTFWTWRKKDKELDERIRAIIDSRVEIVEDALYMNAVNGNITAQIYYLQNRAPNRWQDKRVVKHSGGITIDQRIKDLSDGQLDALLASFYAGYDSGKKVENKAKEN